MIYTEEANNISITGLGTINGNGLDNFKTVRPQNQRPFMIRLVNSKNITVKDISLVESANWTLHLLGSENITIDGITIKTHGQGNRDGIDIDASKNVKVTNSAISTTDDAIVMKATNDSLCRDITIANCNLSSESSAIKTGTESNGGFKNIAVNNIIIRDIPVHTGIDLSTTDGGILQNVSLNNVIMDNVATPIFLNLDLRMRPYKVGQYTKKIGETRDISFHNISVTHAKYPSIIMGIPNKKITDVSIDNFTVRYNQKQSAVAYNEVPYKVFDYPFAKNFRNKIPAYGLYIRDVDQLHLHDLDMYSIDGDERPAMAFDNIDNLNLNSAHADTKADSIPIVHLRNITNGGIEGNSSHQKSNALLHVEENNKNLNFHDNILFSGQKEVLRTKSLTNKKFYEEIKADKQYAIKQDGPIKGRQAVDLEKTRKFDMKIDEDGYYQLDLLVLNTSAQPQKIEVKYKGVKQKFKIDWEDTWGWVPLSLKKQLKKRENIQFEIAGNSQLKMAKAHLRNLHLDFTD